MAVLRFLASLFLLAAVIAFAADVTQGLNGPGGFKASSFAQHWEQLSPKTLSSTKEVMSASRVSGLWTFGIAPIITLPSFVLFGLLAALAGYAGRRRRRVEIYIN